MTGAVVASADGGGGGSPVWARDANRLTCTGKPRQRHREVSLLRALRIADPVQLRLQAGLVEPAGEVWSLLSEPAREETVAILARLIAGGIVADDGEVAEGLSREVAG